MSPEDSACVQIEVKVIGDVMAGNTRQFGDGREDII